VSTKKTAIKTAAEATKTVSISVRLQAETVASISAALRKDEDEIETTSEFLKEAVLNEISRRTLTKRERPADLQVLARMLDQVLSALGETSDQARINSAKMDLIKRALGV
jgi:hypothetical protein